MRVISIIAALTALSWMGHAMAGSADLSSLPCGTQAIELGMSPEEIRTSCGRNWEPTFISKHTRPALRADDGSSDYFEKWMYHTADKNDIHVILKNGEVVRIFTVR